MKPTVSVRMAALPDGRKTERIVVSSVANSLSSDPTSCPVPEQSEQPLLFAGRSMSCQHYFQGINAL